jgi:hypothetical protein
MAQVDGDCCNSIAADFPRDINSGPAPDTAIYSVVFQGIGLHHNKIIPFMIFYYIQSDFSACFPDAAIIVSDIQ